MPAEYEQYRLIKLTGWTEEQLDNTSAELCDWLLACEATEIEATNEMQEEANRRAR